MQNPLFLALNRKPANLNWTPQQKQTELFNTPYCMQIVHIASLCQLNGWNMACRIICFDKAFFVTIKSGSGSDGRLKCEF